MIVTVKKSGNATVVKVKVHSMHRSARTVIMGLSNARSVNCAVDQKI
jgi:hypothetical protein